MKKSYWLIGKFLADAYLNAIEKRCHVLKGDQKRVRPLHSSVEFVDAFVEKSEEALGLTREQFEKEFRAIRDDQLPSLPPAFSPEFVRFCLRSYDSLLLLLVHIVMSRSCSNRRCGNSSVILFAKILIDCLIFLTECPLIYLRFAFRIQNVICYSKDFFSRFLKDTVYGCCRYFNARRGTHIPLEEKRVADLKESQTELKDRQKELQNHCDKVIASCPLIFDTVAL